jgi:hypothetical protein
MGLQPTVFPLHPEFLQIKCQSKEEQLNPDICFPLGQKPTKAEVCFQEPKRTLHLDRPAQAKIDSVI